MVQLTLKKVKDDHRITLYMSGEIDAFTSTQLKEGLESCYQEKATHVILDFGDVHYMDSTGLGVLIGALKHTKQHGIRFQLINLNARLKRLFSITGLTEVMEIKDEGEQGNG
ncbi:STAS domain-containing protein [Microaerobacter geothermalis]|uniref:STAS domain-containing protein n=1 Tax=Microaerobacter geothermalis TaxID=674972 RepID=UPI001F26A8F8|nr:STAS domain-containing protein [Microaerobacter geothermalis]MCF6093753.1 STAS domain-containing protein [Microaerobacter geothermalis]